MKKLTFIFVALCIVACAIRAQDKLPIVYSNDYNISFYGLEKTTPFDTAKYGKVAAALKKRFGKDFYTPTRAITDAELLTVHDAAYLKTLRDRFIVARIAENSLLIAFPISVIEKKLLYPMKLATRGTIEAAELAYGNKRWAINLSGGYHHAERETGDGFCFFADIPLAMNVLWAKDPNLRIFYIDTDAHQGNGVETIFKDKLKHAQASPKDTQLVVFDIFSDKDYPEEPVERSYFDVMLVKLFKQIGYHDPTEDIKKRVAEIRPFIQYKYPLHVSKSRPTNTETYLNSTYILISDLMLEYQKAQKDEKPLVIFYNAGTDPFSGDPVAWLGVSKEGIIERDYQIWKFAHDHKIPIIMTLSGGYSYESADIIADSITNILTKVWGYEQLEQPAQTPKPSMWNWLFWWRK